MNSSCIKLPLLAGTVLLALGAAVAVRAQQATSVTPPVGSVRLACLSNSDTLVSIPFTRPPEFIGAVQSVSGNVVTVANSPGFGPNAFVYAQGVQPNPYYVLLGPGGSAANPKEGRTYPVAANTATTLTLNLDGDDLSAVPAGSRIVLIPNWTPATLFPATDAGKSFTPTDSTRTFKTQLLIPNYVGTGTNLAPAQILYFSNNVNGTANNTGWRSTTDAITVDHGDDPLLPDGYLTVRNANGAPTLPLTTAGSVLTTKLAIPLATRTTGPQDNAVSDLRPVPVALNNLGLTPADGSFVATTSTRAFGDQLFLYDNAQAGFDKAPRATYYFSNNVNGTTNNVGWRLTSDSTTADRGGDLVPAGAAMVIRKAKTASGQTVIWTNPPSY